MQIQKVMFLKRYSKAFLVSKILWYGITILIYNLSNVQKDLDKNYIELE